MDLYSFPPIAAALDAAHSVITWLIAALTPFAAGAAPTLSIVLLTVVIRSLLLPASVAAFRGDLERRRLAPRIAELRTRYSKNPEMLQRKTMELYARERVSPFAGILPLLIQLPVLSLVYGLFVLPTINGHANGLLAETFAGVPLSSSFVGLVGGGSDPLHLAVVGSLLALIALVVWLSRRYAAPIAPQPDVASPGLGAITRVLGFLPFVTVVFAAVVPLAATVYLATTTTWTFVERQVMRRALDPNRRMRGSESTA
ncbi:YidC/Oxa1 family membrane protein insertase [Microbacteriaceae bacterium SG_E_30_P1]|uniref:Membrane protein insertase YidC n=1 Tax=Antiquaquibacter oligotrophicus TaxID=2880260 RepID=A0ABT6KMU0_9MICO|nr:membrane protein insertase YidC [Antiquaquibacter oligotrophicus]MDH6181321.1 YidC/Oxa1 family membrane protein insertase [Antiquaquibacter oligotrophicus]UDF12986.1 YidC/Oxa1 family membrane protein insertase [Antiquaquibacter oligotrophicus]